MAVASRKTMRRARELTTCACAAALTPPHTLESSLQDGETARSDLAAGDNEALRDAVFKDEDFYATQQVRTAGSCVHHQPSPQMLGRNATPAHIT
jgi:hypothetical protein